MNATSGNHTLSTDLDVAHRLAAARSARHAAAGVVFLSAALTSSALLASYSFTSSSVGGSFADDSRAEFAFTVGSISEVTLRTWSYAGGTNAAGELISAGGFDPIVSVFDSEGALIADNDDGSDVVNQETGLSYDALLTLELSEGEYQAVLTEFSNFSDGTINGFSGSDSQDIAEGFVTNAWALDIIGVDAASFIRLINGATPGGGEEPSFQEQIDVSMQAIATNPSTSSTAAVISNACPQAPVGSRFREDCTPIVVGSLPVSGSARNDQASFALATVTAEQATVPLSSSRASLSSQRQNLSTRLSALRGGITGLSVRGLTFEVDGQTIPGLAGAAIDGVGGAASADENPLFAGGGRVGVFINGTVSSADKDASRNEEGFDGDSWSITGGLDYRFRDDLIGGLALGYYSGSSDIDNNGGNLDADGYSLSLYGTYYQGESFYVDGMVTYGNNSYDQRRNIRYQVGGVNVNQSAKADYDGHQWSAAVGTGYMLSNGAWSYGPVARAEYVSASIDGYSERMSNPNANGGGWAARLDDLDQESFTTAFGGEVSRAISTNWGVILPQLHLDWVHEYRDAPVSVNGSFIQDPTGGIFGITGDKPDSDYFNGRLGVSAQFAGGSTAFLYYNKVFGYRDLDVDTVGAGVRLTF